MTVQELIDELNEVKDKSKLVHYFDRISSIYEVIEFENYVILS